MKTPLLLLSSLLASCSLPKVEPAIQTSGKEMVAVEPIAAAPKSAAKVHKPKSTIEIRSVEDWPKGVGKVTQKDGWLVIDGAGWALDGSRLPGKCDQNENNPPVLRIKRDKTIFKNCEIRQSFNGLFTSNNNVVFENLFFSSICEDAINPSRCTNITIRNCHFQGAYDKTLQLNYCKNALVENNTIVGGINGVRFMGTVGIIRGNKFVNCDTAIQTTKKGKSTVSGNSFVGVKTRYKTEEGGVILY
jgi:hypothetical protein